MSAEQLSLSSFVQEMKNVTSGAHPRRFCFVLGAGASRTSGIKSGQELVRVWDKELLERNEDEYHRWRDQLKITDDNMSTFYSYYYEKRFHRCPADGLSFIEGIMESAKPSVGYVMLAHLLATTPHNVVVTTNFDHLSEDAVTYYAQKTPLVIGHEALSRYVTGQQVRPTIIKIHRDLLFDPKSRTEDLEKLPDSWKDALDCIFKNYHPVFVGYAGNDKSLMDYLIENSDNFSNNQWKFPYWLLYKNDTLDGKVKDFLEKSEGYYVSHSGFDEVMIQLGAAFDYQMPAKESFLADAEARYKLLKDAIDGFADKTNHEETVKPTVDIDNKIVSSPTQQDESEDNAGIDEAMEKITKQSEIQNMYHRATLCIAEEKYDESILLLKKLVELDPENVRYQYTLGRVYYLLGSFSEAIHTATQVLEIEPDYPLAHFLMGKSYAKLNNHVDALNEYKKSAKLDPDRVQIIYAIGEELKALGKVDDALVEYHKAVELSPEWAIPHYDIGEIYENREQFEDALKEYKESEKLDPEEPLYIVSVGIVLDKMGKIEEAIDEYKKAIELSPDWSFSYYMLANALEKVEQYDQALDAIKKATDIEPGEAAYHYSASSILDHLGRSEEAKQAFARAAEIEGTEE